MNIDDKKDKSKKSKNNPDDSSKENAVPEILPPEIENAINQLPESERKAFRQISSFSMSSVFGMPKNNPLLNKMTPEHISTLLENSDREDERGYKAYKFSNYIRLVFVVIGIGVFIFLVVFLKENVSLLNQLLTYTLPFLIGLAGGFGLGRSTKPRDIR